VKPLMMIAVLAVSALVCGCGAGVRAADLFIVYRSGATTGARLTLLVNEEGGAHCNGRPANISNDQLVEARSISEALEKPSSEHLSLPARAGSVLSYYVRDANGSVSFADDSAGQPAVFHELQMFVEVLAQRVCHLPL
jgi:hypothetical protein